MRSVSQGIVLISGPLNQQVDSEVFAAEPPDPFFRASSLLLVRINVSVRIFSLVFFVCYTFL